MLNLVGQGSDLIEGTSRRLVLPADQVDGADAPTNIQPDSDLGVPVFLVHITVVALLQATGIDPADAALGVRNHAHARGKVDGCLAHAAVDAYVIVVLGLTTKIDPQLANPHVHI